MVKNTIFETIIREAFQICFDEYKKMVKDDQARGIKDIMRRDESILHRKSPRLLTVDQWVKIHGTPSKGGLRSLIFHANKNGFSRCIRRIGRRILIHEDEFFKWIEESNSSEKYHR